jgi:hypothetical protein
LFTIIAQSSIHFFTRIASNMNWVFNKILPAEKSETEKKIKKFEELSPKFTKCCNPGAEKEFKKEWCEMWRLIWTSDDRGIVEKELTNYSIVYNQIVKIEALEAQVQKNLYELINEDDKLKRSALRKVKRLELLRESLSSISCKNNPELCSRARSYAQEIESTEAQILALRKQELEYDVREALRNEELWLKSGVEKLNDQLRTKDKQREVTIWLRGDHSKLIYFGKEHLSGMNFRTWNNEFANLKSSDINVLLNFYEVRTNILESVKSDSEYVALYRIFGGNCLVVRLHQYNNYDAQYLDDSHDSEVPSSILNVQTVLKLQYFTTFDSTTFFDNDNEHFRVNYSHLPLDQKAKNFRYLISKLKNDNSDKLRLLATLRDQILDQSNANEGS